MTGLRSASSVVVLVAACGALAAPALADPAVQGDVQRVNPDVAEQQCCSSVGMAADGRYAVAYSEQQDAGQPDVLLRLFAADGAPAPGVIPVNAGVDRRTTPAVALDSDGDIVVAYAYGPVAASAIRAQRFSAAGSPVGPEIVVSSSGDRQAPRVAIAPDGRFVVVWDHLGDAEARLFAPDGTPTTGELTVDETGFSSNPDVAMDASGRFVVAMQRSTTFGESGAVRARRYTALGAPAGGEFDALRGDLNQNYPNPAIALDDSGRVVTVVRGTVTTSAGALTGLIAQRRDAANAAAGEPFKVNVGFGNILQPAAAMDADGDLLVAYEDQSGGVNGLYVRHYLPDGSADGAPVLVGLGGGQNPAARLALDGTGRMAVSFTASDGAGFNPTGVFARRLRYAAGPPTPPPPDPPVTPPAAQPPAAPAPSSNPPSTLPAFTALVTLPSTKRCVSRRLFRIRIRKPAGGVALVSAEVTVNGKRVKVVRGKRLTAPVDLRNLPKGRFTVKIVATTADGRTIRGTRRYRTCVPKQRAGKR